MPDFKELASGLLFPEGPIAMPDGSVVLVEIRRGTLSRVSPGGKVEVIADLGGGPNGAAIGPDGRCYVCNNGGFEWMEIGGNFIPGEQPADYSGGRIEVVDLDTGESSVLYRECDGIPLRGPNDIVFDREGGFYFSDLGKTRGRELDRGAVYYAKPDGSSIREVRFPLMTPNGVGLSPDEDRLYIAETTTCRLMGFPIIGPGELASVPDWEALVTGFANYQLFDSLAVDAAGNVCVATLVNGGITIISPDGMTTQHVPTGDPMTTNICFGGDELRTAFITCSMSGRLIAGQWETAGLPLNFLNR
jgi:gluconolactonase